VGTAVGRHASGVPLKKRSVSTLLLACQRRVYRPALTPGTNKKAMPLNIVSDIA